MFTNLIFFLNQNYRFLGLRIIFELEIFNLIIFMFENFIFLKLSKLFFSVALKNLASSKRFLKLNKKLLRGSLLKLL